jgi:N-acetylglucosaminyl-diphospho-decaprenol L-rhamnosyltransferase
MQEPQAPELPLVSALVVSFHCAEALRRCLQALEASADRDKMEVVVVDNGSLDGTPDVAAEFPAVTLLRLPRNFGFVKALNIAMRTAKSEFFLIVDPYVSVEPDTVRKLTAKLTEETDAVAVAPLLASETGEPRPELYRLPGLATLGSICRAGRFTSAAAPDLAPETAAVEFAGFGALMVRGYFLKGLRYIDERYAQSWADAELAMQVHRSGRNTLLMPTARAVRHGDAPADWPPNARALLEADFILGAATYAAKHFGSLAGLKIRLAAALQALGSALAFRDAGFRFARLRYLLSGQRIDGTQSAL